MKKQKKKEKINLSFPAYKDYVKNLCGEIRRILFHGEYSMSFCWDTELTTKDTMAEIRIDCRYLNFTISFSKKMFELWKDKEFHLMAEVVVHELCHLLTEPLYLEAIPGSANLNREYLEDIRERQTQRMANVVMNLLPPKLWTLK